MKLIAQYDVGIRFYTYIYIDCVDIENSLTFPSLAECQKIGDNFFYWNYLKCFPLLLLFSFRFGVVSQKSTQWGLSTNVYHWPKYIINRKFKILTIRRNRFRISKVITLTLLNIFLKQNFPPSISIFSFNVDKKFILIFPQFITNLIQKI